MNIKTSRKMKALVSFICHVSRKTNSVSSSVQPQSVLISFTRQTDLMLERNHISPIWSGSEMEIFRETSQLYNCSYACQTCVWNNLLWLWEVFSFIRWCVPQNGRRHCAKFSAPHLQPQQLPAAAAAENHPCVDKLNVGRALSQTFFFVK